MNLAVKTACYKSDKCIVLGFVDKLVDWPADNNDDAAMLG